MTVLGWIFVGILAVSLFFFIFSLIKNWKIPATISQAFILPTATGISASFLYQLLPLTKHILFLSIVALAIETTSEILFIFENKKFFRYTGRFLFLLGLCPWIELYISTFYIYTVPQWGLILAGVIYGILLIALLIFCGKCKLGYYFWILIGFVMTGFLSFSAVISLCYKPVLNYILLTIGTVFLLISYVFYAKQTAKPFISNKKLETILRTTFITLAEVLITTSGIFMIM